MLNVSTRDDNQHMNETVQLSRQRHIFKMIAKAECHEELASDLALKAKAHEMRAKLLREEAARHKRLQQEVS